MLAQNINDGNCEKQTGQKRSHSHIIPQSAAAVGHLLQEINVLAHTLAKSGKTSSNCLDAMFRITCCMHDNNKAQASDTHKLQLYAKWTIWRKSGAGPFFKRVRTSAQFVSAGMRAQAASFGSYLDIFSVGCVCGRVLGLFWKEIENGIATDKKELCGMNGHEISILPICHLRT